MKWDVITKFQEHGKPAAFVKKRRELRKESWFIFRWEVLFVMLMTSVIAILNMIPEWNTNTNAPRDALIFELHPLFQNAIFQNISIVISIALSLWVILFIESGKYLGKYGSSIFILVPSLIWVMSDRHNSFEKIMEMQELLDAITTYGFFAMFGTFLLVAIIKIILIKQTRDIKMLVRYEVVFNAIYRIFFIGVNLSIALISSLKFINFGIVTLDLTNEGHGMGEHIMSEKYIAYIATISVLCGFLLIVVGLTGGFNLKQEIEYINSKDVRKRVGVKNWEEMKIVKDLTVEFKAIKKKRKILESKKAHHDELHKVTQEINVVKKKITKLKRNNKGGI